MRALVVALMIMVGAGQVHAEKDYVPWYRGKYGHNRIVHLTLTASLGLVYLAQATVLEKTLVPTGCRWCEPPPFDRVTRNALVWSDVKRADFLSSMDAYVLAPAVGFTLLIIADRDASWSRLIDDITPVAETVAVSQVFVAFAKILTARTRPYKYFHDPNQAASPQDYLSFPSGHASLGFAITAGSAMVCHWRHYWTEPYVWGAGIALSVSVEYLRMAADKHWLSDVLVSGVVGIGSGLLIPGLMRRDVKIVPVPNGAAVVGQF